MTLVRGLRLWTAGAACLCLTTAGVQGRPQKEVKEITRIVYGDVFVEKPAEIVLKLNPVGLKVIGKNTLVTIPYVRSKALLKVHADTITTKRIEKDDFAETTLEGSVRFTVSQTQQSGTTRSLIGTAKSGVFSRATQKITLTGDVSATLTDGENLVEPAKFTASRIEVDMSVNPYRYTLIGGDDKHEFRIRPKDKSTGKRDPNKSSLVAGEIYVHDYDRVELQSKSDMLFVGSRTVFELREADGDGYIRAHSPRIQAVFGGVNSELLRLEASGGVQIHTEQAPKLANGKRGIAETIDGYTSSFVQDIKKRTLTFEGGIHITLASPEKFAAPAEVVAERIITDYIEGKQQRFQIYGNPATSKLTVHPKPTHLPLAQPVNSVGAPPTEEKPVSNFQWGALSFTRFAYGSWEVGKEAEVRGNRLLLESKNTDTKAELRFLAQHINVKFSSDSLVKSVVAEGAVEYSVQIKPKSTKEGKDRQLQIVKGTTPRILFANSKQGEDQTAEITGPFRMEIVAPEKLLEPGIVEGKDGDSIRVRLIQDSYEFDILSPKETATIRLLPLELVEAESKDAPNKKRQP